MEHVALGRDIPMLKLNTHDRLDTFGKVINQLVDEINALREEVDKLKAKSNGAPKRRGRPPKTKEGN